MKFATKQKLAFLGAMAAIVLVSGGAIGLLAYLASRPDSPEAAAYKREQLRRSLDWCHGYCVDAGAPFWSYGGGGCNCGGPTR